MQEAGVASQNTVRLREEEGRPRGSARPAHEEVLGGHGKDRQDLTLSEMGATAEFKQKNDMI